MGGVHFSRALPFLSASSLLSNQGGKTKKRSNKKKRGGAPPQKFSTAAPYVQVKHMTLKNQGSEVPKKHKKYMNVDNRLLDAREGSV